MIYLICANSKKLTTKTVSQYFRLYHAQHFPLIDQNKIYKKISDNLFLLRVGKNSSPGDMLGYLTQSLALSDRDNLYCIPINEELSDRISERTEQSLCYLGVRSLDQLNDRDCKHITLEYNLTDTIYFLAHYFQMLEQTSKFNIINENENENENEYVLLDKHAQYQSKKLYGEEYTIDKYNRGRKNQKIIYTRFCYEDLIEDYESQNISLIKASKILGFNLKFKIIEILANKDMISRLHGIVTGKIYDKIDKEIWDNKNIIVGIIFTGSKNWKEKIQFEIDLKFYNQMRKNTIGGEKLMVFKKPTWNTLN